MIRGRSGSLVITQENTWKNPACWLRAGLLGFGYLFLAAFVAQSAPKPNILWITSEDNGPHLGCYGDAQARTPNLDALAARGLRYLNAWSAAPVCAPARTTIITGVYPTSTGSEHMRSMVRLPSNLRLYPQLLRESGYYCSNNSKEDYNVVGDGRVWDDSSRTAHWRKRPEGAPFFAIFNFTVSHESQIRTRPHTQIQDPSKIRLPAYHPDTPEVRRDWGQYYDKIAEMDAQAGDILRQLEEDGLAEDTIIFYYGDHGSGMPRSKRWPYNSGLHVPLIVVIPDKWSELAPAEYAPGGTTERLVSFVDLAPTLLSLTGVRPETWMQGRAFLGRYEARPNRYLYGFRGRMDERMDLVRSIRDNRYVYIRNYMPHRIYGQHLDYMFQTPTTRIWKTLYDEGKLQPPQTYFWETKPVEEMYDLDSDPDEVVNLATSREHQSKLRELRGALRSWILQSHDVGFLPEDEMHRRAGAQTIYEMGRNRWRYPVERVLTAAELASGEATDARTLRQFERWLGDRDSGVRYWAAMACVQRGGRSLVACRAGLLKALEDVSPSVAVASAWALALHGSAEDLDKALAALKGHLDPEKNGVHLAVFAMNVLDDIGEKGRPLAAYVQTMPKVDPKADRRLGDYVLRLSERINPPVRGARN